MNGIDTIGIGGWSYVGGLQFRGSELVDNAKVLWLGGRKQEGGRSDGVPHTLTAPANESLRVPTVFVWALRASSKVHRHVKSKGSIWISHFFLGNGGRSVPP